MNSMKKLTKVAYKIEKWSADVMQAIEGSDHRPHGVPNLNSHPTVTVDMVHS